MALFCAFLEGLAAFFLSADLSLDLAAMAVVLGVEEEGEVDVGTSVVRVVLLEKSQAGGPDDINGAAVAGDGEGRRDLEHHVCFGWGPEENLWPAKVMPQGSYVFD